MVKIVPDTNLLISSMLGYENCPRKLINLALNRQVTMYGSGETYKEFIDVIRRPKFRKYLSRQIFTPEKLIMEYRTLITMVEPGEILKGVRITSDPDDDAYFRVAKACEAKIIVSGDSHLLNVKKFEGIIVVTPSRFVASLMKIKQIPPA